MPHFTSLKELRMTLLRLVEEDRRDIEAAREAKKELEEFGERPIPLHEIAAELGMSHLVESRR